MSWIKRTCEFQSDKKQQKQDMTILHRYYYYLHHETHLYTLDSSSAVVFLDVHVDLRVPDKTERKNKTNTLNVLYFVVLVKKP